MTATAVSWQSSAACRTWPTDMFFPLDGDDPTPALEVCAGCTVRDRCLVDALADRQSELAGSIAGGYTADQRRAIREGRPVPKPRAPKPCARCGTRFSSTATNAKYCPTCRPTVRAAQLVEQSRRREARLPFKCKVCHRRWPDRAGLIRHRCSPNVHLVTEAPG